MCGMPQVQEPAFDKAFHALVVRAARQADPSIPADAVFKPHIYGEGSMDGEIAYGDTRRVFTVYYGAKAEGYPFARLEELN